MEMQFKSLNIPVAVVGPGSQPEEEDGAVLDYLQMPHEMSVFHAPLLMDEQVSAYPAVEQVLCALQDSLTAITQKNLKTSLLSATDQYRIELSHLSAEDAHFLNRFLGEGEVAVKVTLGNQLIAIQETVLTGVWRVTEDQVSVGRREWIEVGSLPSAVIQQSFTDALPAVALPSPLPSGVINAPAVIHELNARSADYLLGQEGHTLNLSLLPQTPEDITLLMQVLGVGNTVALSRGYGACRVSATQLTHVWWVQYFNSDDRMILNSLEVVDFPIVIQASLEDIEDSVGRLAEMVEAVS